MVNFLSAEHISKSYGDKSLFEELSFGLQQGQKIALIGVNGSGKSTLLKVLAGIETPDSGRVSVRKGIKIAFLPQEPQLPMDLTVSEWIFSYDQPALQLIREYEELLSEKEPNEAQQDRLQTVMSEIDIMNAWDFEVRINQILGRLDVNFLDRKIAELSGGQRKRVAMAQALIGEPELLIMDEPTNHLDLASIEWLEQFLSTSKQSLIMVTHDRYFLDSVTNEIMELDGGNLYSYKGDYAYFLQKQHEREAGHDQGVLKAQNLLRKELEWLRRSPKARGTKAKYRIDAAHELKATAQNVRETQDIELQVKGRRIGGKVLELKKLRKAYEDLVILDDFTYTFNRKDRIGIVGPNGVGKTTFLNILIEEEAVDSGKVRKGETIVFGYYRQGGLTMKPNQRVIEVVTEAAETVELSKSQTLSAAQLLEHFLFPRHMHSAMVETLSGGEKRRLHLLRMLMTNPNFLILDEPTNDLDLVTLRKLEEFLEAFDGCLVVATHDRFFMDRMVDHLFVFEGDGKIKDFPGSYSQYRTWKAEQEKIKLEEVKPVESAPAPKTKKRHDTVRKLSYKEKREYESLETEIAEMEARKTELNQLLNSGESDYSVLTDWTQELETLADSLEEKEMRWLELAEIAE